MLSAFGVDHGAFSKALSPSQMTDALKAQHTASTAAKTARKAAKKVTPAQRRTQGHDPNFVTRPQHVKNFLNRVGEADISIKGIGRGAGVGAGATGRFVERHPGLTGTALVGGGSVGGYKYLSNREPKKKTSS